MDKAGFRELFGAVYEHSPWLAERVFDTDVSSIMSDADALSARFEAVFMESGEARQLAVLRAHPQLACARAEQASLTDASKKEQSGAGLDQCSDIEFKQFIGLNNKYMNKNKFPFIIAVRGRSRQEILKAFQARLEVDTASEFQTALRQVCQIARFRIDGILSV